MPLPDEPMIETTSPFSAEKLTSFNALKEPKDLFTLRNVKNAILYPIITEFLFQIIEQQREQSHEEEIERARVEEGPDQSFARENIRGHHDFHHADDARERGVFDEGDNFVGHGGENALDDLHEGDFEKDLSVRHAEHLSRLDLSLGDPFDPPSENFRKVAGVIEREGDDGGEKGAPVFDAVIEVEGIVERSPKVRARFGNHARQVIDDEQLQHQRHAAHDPYDHFEKHPYRGAFAHRERGDEQPQGQGENQSQYE